MKTIKPTEHHAAKIVELLSHGLVCGMGKPIPGQMCVEAAVCHAMGLPHGDDPQCVSPAVRSLKIGLNDSQWSSNQARADGLRELAVAQLGSNTLDDAKFVELFVLRLIQKFCPVLFRALAALLKEEADREAMERAALDCESATDAPAAVEILRTHHALALALARALALALDLDRARARALALDLALALDRARARALALDLALDLARALALALDLDRARALGGVKNYDDALRRVSQIALGVLIEMKSPGCKWLALCRQAAHTGNATTARR